METIIIIILSVVLVIALLALFQYYKRYTKISKEFDPLKLEIFDTSDSMIFVFDKQFRVVKLYNPDWLYMRLPADIMEGSNIFDVLEYKFAHKLESVLKNVFKTGNEIDTEIALSYMEHKIELFDGADEESSDKNIEFFECRFRLISVERVVCYARNFNKRKVVEQYDRESINFMKSVLDNLPIPLMLKDIDNDYRYIYWNKECENKLGFNANDIIGKTDTEIYGVERGSEQHETDAIIADSHKTRRSREFFSTPDGRLHVADFTKGYVTNGSSRWIIVMLWDITELVETKRRIEELNKLNGIVLDNAQVGLVLLDNNYNILWENIDRFMPFNEHVSRLVSGSICYQSVCKRETPCVDCQVTETFNTSNITTREYTLGDGLVIDITAIPTFDKSKAVDGVVLKLEDVTAKRKAERELKQAKEQAEQLEKQKSKFIVNVCHEIRTPLNAVLGFCDLISSTVDEAEREKFNALIHDNSDLMLQLVDDILELSKFETDSVQFVFESTNISDVLNASVNDIRLIAADAGKNVIVNTNFSDENCLINTDRKRLKQVAMYLISNVISNDRNAVEITIGFEQREKELYVYVTDPKHYISEENIQYVFDKFSKFDFFVPETSLRLSVCESIVKHLNGLMGVKSSKADGSTFWFTLPIENIFAEENCCI